MSRESLTLQCAVPVGIVVVHHTPAERSCTMKTKLLNAPNTIVTDAIEGLVQTVPHLRRLDPDVSLEVLHGS
jgi:hypothetical protein